MSIFALIHSVSTWASQIIFVTLGKTFGAMVKILKTFVLDFSTLYTKVSQLSNPKTILSQ